MAIIENGQVQKLYKGDHSPVNLYRGEQKIAGWKDEVQVGEAVNFSNSYNDVAEVVIEGNTVQQSDWYAKEGLSSQANTHPDMKFWLNGRNFTNSPQTTVWTDLTGNGYNASCAGFNYTALSGSDGDDGLVFSGTSRAIVSNFNQSIGANFTISFWAKFAEYSYMQIMDCDAFQFKWRISNQNPYWNIRKLDGSLVAGHSYPIKPPLNEWHCYSLTYDGAVVKRYYDESFIGEVPCTGQLKVPTCFNVGLDSGEVLRGAIGNILFLTRAYSATEISNLVKAGRKLVVPNPALPSPITSNLPAGTYKYTSTDGIYEFTLDEELRGIGTSVDRIVFDRTSKTGKLERRLGRKIINGSETFSNYSAGMTAELSTFYVNINLSALGFATSWSSHFKNVFGGWDYPISEHYSDHPSNTFKYLSIFNRVIGAVSSDTYTVRNDKFKSWLSTNNVTFIYRLATPTTTPLTFTKVSSSTKTEVPMTFLTATPSLDYQAQVWDVEGKAVSRGKNLFDVNLLEPTSAGFSVEGNGVKAETLYGNIANLNWSAFLKPNTTYTLFRDYKQLSGVSSGSYGSIRFTGGPSTITILGNGMNGPASVVFTTPVDLSAYSKILFYQSSAAGAVAIFDNIQIYEGTWSTTDFLNYEPYQPIVNTTLPTLRKIGTVADTYNPKTGVLTKRISDWVTLDGSKSWGEYSAWPNWKGTYLANVFGTNTSSDLALIYKYDSTKISFALGGDGYQTFGLPHLYMYLNDNDTGFGVKPSTMELKAYFYGWKMCNSDGTSPYYKSEVPYNPTTWAEWTKEGVNSGDSTGLTFNNNAGCNINASFKPSVKYGILVELINGTVTMGGGGPAFPFGLVADGKLTVIGKNKIIHTTPSSFTTNKFTSWGAGKIKDIRVFELPAGSQIETDFTNLTADQLAAKYTFNGLCVKNWKKVTDGTGQTATLPTASYAGYTPYKMIYQLATPQEIQLTPSPIPTYHPTTIIETDYQVAKPTIRATVKVEDI